MYQSKQVDSFGTWRYATEQQATHRLLATALVDYEHKVTQTESHLWSLRVIRDSLRGALEIPL